MMSVPINPYCQYDCWLEWLTYQEEGLTFVCDVRRETTLPSRLVAELHRFHLSAPYAVKSRRFYQIRANTNNMAHFDRISVLNGGPFTMETEERLWECGRYASFHVAPLAGAAGKRFPPLLYTPVGFKTMVALPTVYKIGFGQAPNRMITELYLAAVSPDVGRVVSTVMHDRSAALSKSTVEDFTDIRLCRNPAQALYFAH
eukprot:4050358-Pleurochrysis_carterae.AAC.4